MEGRRYRIAVVGSREFSEPERVRAFIASLPPHTIIVSGMARGVDTIAREAAIERGLNIIDVPAQWQAHGRGAGFRRNGIIVEISDEVVAFWDGESKGTAHTLSLCRREGKKLRVFTPKGAPA